jgi:hypothetical protein
MGRLGLEVADVGRGGRSRRGDVRPGMSRATTFCMERVFCGEFTDQEALYSQGYSPLLLTTLQAGHRQ